MAGTEGMFGGADSRAIDWDFVRSLAGLVALLLGVTGIVIHNVLALQQVLPDMSWLWVASVILGSFGIASSAYDFARIAWARIDR